MASISCPLKVFQVSFNNSILAGGIMMNFGGKVEGRVGTEDWALISQ